MQRGDICWADLGDPQGSAPGFRRPVVIVQSDAFNRSRLRTVVAAAITSNIKLLDAPGNILLPARACGLKRDSVVNVSQIVTIDRDVLSEPVGRLTPSLLADVAQGLRLVLAL